MKSYKPAEHSETANVAPLVQFFELVHIGDTIQSMVQVYFEKELVSFFLCLFMSPLAPLFFFLWPPFLSCHAFLSSPSFLLHSRPLFRGHFPFQVLFPPRTFADSLLLPPFAPSLSLALYLITT
jgi:hypothetical protein